MDGTSGLRISPGFSFLQGQGGISQQQIQMVDAVQIPQMPQPPPQPRQVYGPAAVAQDNSRQLVNVQLIESYAVQAWLNEIRIEIPEIDGTGTVSRAVYGNFLCPVCVAPDQQTAFAHAHAFCRAEGQRIKSIEIRVAHQIGFTE